MSIETLFIIAKTNIDKYTGLRSENGIFFIVKKKKKRVTKPQKDIEKTCILLGKKKPV